MSENIGLYRHYLCAAWLHKHLEAAELRVKEVSFNLNDWVKKPMDFDTVEERDLTYGFMFHVTMTIEGSEGWDISKSSDEARAMREEHTARALAQIPGARLIRLNGEMYLYGKLPGIVDMRWHLSMGSGVCERVKVGTRTVMRPDPSVPLVEVIEDVYEVRCVDPIVAASR